MDVGAVRNIKATKFGEYVSQHDREDDSDGGATVLLGNLEDQKGEQQES